MCYIAFIYRECYVTCDLTSYVTCYNDRYIAYVLKQGTCSTQGSARVCKHLQAKKSAGSLCYVTCYLARYVTCYIV